MSSTASANVGRPNLRRDASTSAIMAGSLPCHLERWPPPGHPRSCCRGRPVAQLTASWVWAISVGAGVVCLIFSWITRQPVMVAWSVPGAALLITQLGLYPFWMSSGPTSSAAWWRRSWARPVAGQAVAAVPKPITAAVLAGVLFPFVIKVATAVVATPIVAGGLVMGYLVGRRWNPRYGVFVAVAVGGLLVVTTGATQALAIRMAVTVPTWTTPTFSLDAILGIAVPLFIVTAAGQNAPGLIVMHHSGYEANDRLLLGACGMASVLFAPFASHQLNMAAVTAAIATSGESHPDKNRRYIAGMSCGVFYILGGLLATFIVSLFSAIPAGMITALAGVALLSPLQASLYDTMHEGTHQKSVLEAALITLAVTVSGIQPLGVVSAFWGLLAGVVAYGILRKFRRSKPLAMP